MGSHEQEGDKLSFGKMAATVMACPEGMDIERVLVDALEKT
jgi:heat shock protein HslJ